MYTVSKVKVIHFKLRRCSFPDLATIFIDAPLDYVSLNKQDLVDHLIFNITMINEML